MSQKSYDNSPSVYLIPTPIGNMDDITLRTIKILSSVDVIFSEDTRVTAMLLKHLDIKKELIANHKFNEQDNFLRLSSFLNNGKNVGIVTDRGTPVISDPGYGLAKYAIENNYNVIGLPGATAVIPALITSGINPMPFLFYGFLNNKTVKRKKELEALKYLDYTIIFYEAPHRILDMLSDVLEVMGNRKVSISREISKKYEEIYRGRIIDVIKELENVKGEFVVVIEGNNSSIDTKEMSIKEQVDLYVDLGNNLKEAIKLVAQERNVSKSVVYSEYHNLGK